MPSTHEAVIDREEGQFRLRHSDPHDHIWRVVRETGLFYEADFLEVLGKELKPGDLVLDVGANIGNHSVYFAGVCEARVIAFEPNPDALVLLRENIAANGLRKRIDVRDFALGAAAGKVSFDLSAAKGNLGAVRLTASDSGVAQVRRLDDLKLPGPPKLIKIDAEGMDFDVLHGAAKVLAEHKPIVAVEAADRRLYNEIADFLDGLGYLRRDSLNYTPTHIFVPVARGRSSQFSRQVARELGGAYVEMAGARASADRRISTLQGRIASVEGTLATTTRDMASALAADVQRIEAGIAALNVTLKVAGAEAAGRDQVFEGSLGEVRSTVAGIASRLDARFEDTKQALSDQKGALERVANQLGAANHTTGADLAALKVALKQLDESLGARLKAVKDDYEGGQEALGHINVRVRELQAALMRLSDTVGLVTHSVDTQVHESRLGFKAHSEFAASIGKKVTELSGGLGQVTATLAELVPHIDERFGETSGELKRAAEANRLISSRIHSLETGLLDLAGNMSDVTGLLDLSRREFAAGLDRAALQSEAMAGAITAIDASTSQQLKSLEARLVDGECNLNRFASEVDRRWGDISVSFEASQQGLAKVDTRARELQASLVRLGDRVDQVSQESIVAHAETAARIARSEEAFQAGFGELRHIMSSELAATEQAIARSEEVSKRLAGGLREALNEATGSIRTQVDAVSLALVDGETRLRQHVADLGGRLVQQAITHSEEVSNRLAGSLSEQLAEATASLGTQVVAASSALANAETRLWQRLDGLGGRLEAQSSSLRAAVSGSMAELSSALASAAAEQKADLHDGLQLVETSASRRAAEASARLSAIEAAQSEQRTSLQRLEGDVLAGMEISARMGLWVDRRIEETQFAVGRQISEAVDEVRQTLVAELRSSASAQLQLVGRAVANMMVELERRQPEGSAPVPPPRRPLGLDALRNRGLTSAPFGGPEVRLLAERRPAESGPAAPASDPVAPARRRRMVAPVNLPASGIDAGAVPGEMIACIDTTGSWKNLGWSQSGAMLEDGGVVSFASGAHWPGFVTAKYPAASGGVVRVTVEVAACDPIGGLLARIRNDRDEQCGPDVPLTPGINTFRVFAPERTQALKAYILVRPPTSGGSFSVRSIRFDRLDADAHQRAVRASVGQPVLASMASIPSRRRMLRDCVNSLLAQCDQVRVFLNNYPDVPDFLDHPRIEVRRSQDWDDRGDAGKVFWIDRDREEGYRLVTDDDLLFPPDFAERMCGKVRGYGDRAIFCTHGILLRQPIRQYYDSDSRAATFHFARQLDSDVAVHIGATNAMCFHSGAVRMKWSDFSYCNSADVWISLYAQRQGLPMLAASRLQGWVRENIHDAPEDTIYNHSRKRTKSRMDSSLVQDAALRHAGPLTLQATSRPKLGLAVVVEDAGSLKAMMESWAAARSVHVDWVVSLIPASEPERFRAALADTAIEHETHLFDTDAPLAARIAAARRLAVELGVDATLFVTDAMRFPHAGWEGAVFSPAGVKDRLLMLCDAPDGGTMVAPVAGADLHRARAFIERFEIEPDLPPAPGSRSTLKLDRPPGSESVLTGAVFVERAVSAPAVFRQGRKPRGGRINDVFERVIVLNLDRRPDRWAQTQNQLNQAGITAERFSAVDGSLPEVDAEYREYAAQPLVGVPQGQRELKYSEDFYIKAESQAARVAHLEQRSGKKAVASRGAWGYLKSYRAILEQAMKDQVESLLVFDDDILFHRNTVALFDAVSRQLPEDWLMLQLGTLQYNWKAPWFEPVSENLYRTRGSAIGSHAAGIRFEMMPYLLDHASRMDMPFDVGALSAATQAYSDRSFITLPNLAIQRLGAESDISTSDFQKQTDIAEIADRYRWNLADYFLDLP